jgi:hypothetical protein
MRTTQERLLPLAPSNVWDARALLGERAAWPIESVFAEFRACSVWPTRQQWNEHATQHEGEGAIQFCDNAARRRGAPWRKSELYDGRIFLGNQVPSREACWHDFFNMLVWRTFPKAKRAINKAQWLALGRWLPGEAGDKLPGARLPEQDALALLDEGGLILLYTNERAAEITRAVEAREEGELLAMAADGVLVTLLFGHALYEHLVTGQGEVRAAYVPVGLDGANLPQDEQELVRLADAGLARAVERGQGVKRGSPGLSVSLARARCCAAEQDARFT